MLLIDSSPREYGHHGARCARRRVRAVRAGVGRVRSGGPGLCGRGGAAARRRRPAGGPGARPPLAGNLWPRDDGAAGTSYW